MRKFLYAFFIVISTSTISTLIMIDNKKIEREEITKKSLIPTNNEISKLITNSHEEKIQLESPIIIIKLKNGNNKISSLYKINLEMNEIIEDDIQHVQPIFPNQIILKHSSTEMKNKYGPSAAILKLDQDSIFINNINDLIFPKNQTKDIMQNNYLQNINQYINLLRTPNQEFIFNSCFLLKDLIIRNRSLSFNDNELFDILESNESYIKNFITSFKINGIEIIEKSLINNSFSPQQCYLVKFSNLKSFLIFNRLFQVNNR